jgi:hypothetical protein
MEILARLGSLLSPTFFAILAGLSLTAAALLFVAGKRDVVESQVKGTKLSELEPTGYRGTGYLLLAFGWSMFGLVLGFIFAAIGTRVFGSLILVILSLLCLLFTLCFLYAGGGALFRAVTAQKGTIAHFFFPFMGPIDNRIVRFGDFLTADLFRQLWYPEIVIENGGIAEAIKETPTTVMSGSEKAKAADEIERLRHKLAEYEARLTPEQREKLMEERRIVEELKGIYS